jgi:hypothetical protein
MAQTAAVLLIYAVTVAFAVAQGWRANDLVWGFWVSGIAVTLYAAVAVPFFSLVRQRESAESDGWAVRIIKVAGLSFANLGAFGLLVVPLFFSPTGIMLNSYSPLVPQDMFHFMQGKFLAAYLLADDALRHYWPLAVVCCIACSSSIFHATVNAREAEENNVAGLIATIEALRAAVVVVLAMVIQFGLGTGTKTAAIASYVLLALLLFPWTRIFEWNGAKSPRTNG